MPPRLAALLCAIFIAYLFWMERKKSKDFSAAMWIPFAWMFLAGSRYISHWLELGRTGTLMEAYMEGSPADRGIFTVLIVAGLIVLLRRRAQWGQILLNNKWIVLYFAFGLLSAVWSDYSFVSLKRLFKALGNVIMVLVVLTESRPYESALALLRRLTYVCVPLSVLFIKYYPDFGRMYHPWNYQPMYTGVSTQKNGLGQICLVAAICIGWALLKRAKDSEPVKKLETAVNLFLLFLVAYLINKANSATSLACMVMAGGIFFVSRMPAFTRNPRRIVTLGVTAVCVFAVLEVLFDVSHIGIRLLGRDPTLTTRVPMWQGLLEMATNPLLGSGYESFWLGDRLRELWGEYGQLKQAHNGYLEIYLNLGLIGLSFMIGAMLSGLVKVRNQLGKDPAAVLRLCFIVVVVLYNWTEATFYGASNMWVLLLLGIVDTSQRRPMSPLAEPTSQIKTVSLVEKTQPSRDAKRAVVLHRTGAGNTGTNRSATRRHRNR